jgi:hypothetical protein
MQAFENTDSSGVYFEECIESYFPNNSRVNSRKNLPTNNIFLATPENVTALMMSTPPEEYNFKQRA